MLRPPQQAHLSPLGLILEENAQGGAGERGKPSSACPLAAALEWLGLVLQRSCLLL